LTLFDGLRASIEDLLNGRTPSGDRGAQIHLMKQALVQARLAVEDLQGGVSATRVRLESERTELATVRRRRELAAAISDEETVKVAERFEAQHTERVTVLENKLAAQQAEIELAERELAEMTAQLRAAAAGVGDGPAARPPSDAELGLSDDEALGSQINALRRAAERAAHERTADDRLAELKKRMGLE